MRDKATNIEGLGIYRTLIHPHGTIQTEFVFRSKTGKRCQVAIDDGLIRDSRRLMSILDQNGYTGPKIKSEDADTLKQVADAYARSPEGQQVTIRIAEHGGWSQDLSFFQYGEFRLPSKEKVPCTSQNIGVELKRRGTLHDWIATVARPARHSSRIMLALCAAFAAPLLRLLDDEPDNFGFNFWGPSSTGKTTTTDVAGSTIARGSAATWDGTVQGLQDLAQAYNDLPLTIDAGEAADTGQGDRLRQQFAYKLSKGKTRVRNSAYMAEHGQATSTFRTIYLSTNEQAEAEKMRLGASVRFIGVPVPADSKTSHGVIDYIPPPNIAGDRRCFSERIIKSLNAAIAQNHGHAMPEFIHRVHANVGRAQGHARASINNFIDQPAFAQLDTSQRRVLRRFAVCRAAGFLAIEYGILPWTRAHLGDAICRCVWAALEQPSNYNRLAAHNAQRILEWLMNPERAVLAARSNLSPDQIRDSDYVLKRDRAAVQGIALVMPNHLRTALNLSDGALKQAIAHLVKDGFIQASARGNTKQHWFRRGEPNKFRLSFYHIYLRIASSKST
ncbi:DUF927 domain-containing protein [Methylobacterium sp. Leaf93]|uniref:DUF927 domain-containing protein n=1 Tax=Methylobacterium sp. Leaf93 TaxID=1736249 RepID=UPI000A9AEAEB|nr:DUF927 domain-containing protein [Methylobacterium sp. Leaf93]